jgi:hypothetical protein
MLTWPRQWSTFPTVPVVRISRLIPTQVAATLLAIGLGASGTPARSEATNHWAFKAVARPRIPEVGSPEKERIRTPIDSFILARLPEDRRRLSPEADRRTLIRRLSFDLRGLPPTTDEIRVFLEDLQPDAWERLVERFLESPAYGERWGRHWLDVVAYADSNGYFSADTDRPLAWKYRDYVVQSIQEDRPFDRFIQEQIAGDELVGYARDGDLTPAMVEPLIATHFWRNAPDGSGESDGNPLEVKVDKYAVLEGNVQLVGNAFLGLTLQCARCHDHKFEPVKQTDYYALEAVLRPAFDPDHWLKPNERTLAVGTRAEREEHQRRTATADRELKTLREAVAGLAAPFRQRVLNENLGALDEATRKAIHQALETKEKERSAEMKSLLKTHAAQVEIPDETLRQRFPDFAAAARSLDDSIRRHEADKPKPLDQIAALTEGTSSPPAHHVLVRGNHAAEGAEVSAGPPSALASPAPVRMASHEVPGTSGRRLALARWLTAPENPLVARVLVNRIWFHHFGRGLAPTPDNLGLSGARPTHPELLDWLATEFVRSGWSLKRMHRLMVNSAVYRQRGETAEDGKTGGREDGTVSFSGLPVFPSSKDEADGKAAPFDANLYTAFPLHRLDAESIRDALLAVSGELDLRRGGPYVPTKADGEGQITVDEHQPGAHRRSLYLQQRRTQPVALLQVFDGPAHNPVCIQRVPSTVALQSLSLLNSEFIRARARAFARRVLAEQPLAASGDGRTPLTAAFELAYGRAPTAAEHDAGIGFLARQTALYADKPDGSEHAWTDFCQMLLASNQFLYVE